MKKYIDLFIAFMRCGIFGFGGGQATVPLIQEEVVENYKWLTMEEFIDAQALAQSLPGPVTTKMATFTGYKVGGILGAAMSILGIVIPSTIGILLLGSFYLKHREETWMQGMLTGLRPVIVVLVARVAFLMGKVSFSNNATWIIALIALVLLLNTMCIQSIYCVCYGCGGVFLK